MPGTGIALIKRRIKSVKNTKKITKAMGFVASAKLRKCKEKLKINDEYNTLIHEVMHDILNDFEGDNIFINGSRSNKKLYIILTSDTGLCGGFNVSVVNTVFDEVKNNRENSLVIVVGQKGRHYLNKLKCETVAEYVEIPDIPSMKESSIIAAKSLNMYKKSEVGEVYIVYSEFGSSIKREVKIKKILPLTKEEKVENNKFIEYEPDVNTLFDEIIQRYLEQNVLNCMLNSKTSEQSARREAMNAATQNADELIDKLHLKYNRLRQSVITQEISEIVGGAEVQK